MKRILAAALVVVAACDGEQVILEPEEIDVCPVVADQVEALLAETIAFLEEASTEEIMGSGGPADDLARRGVELSQRAVDLGCDPAEVRASISVDVRESDGPLARQFIETIIGGLD